MTKLETARLRLREMDEAEAAFMVEVLNEPAFIRNIGDRGVRTTAEAANYIHQRIILSYERFGFGMWLVELMESGEPVGICGLIKRDTLEDVDLGFSVLERFWRRGFALEAAAAVLEYGWSMALLQRIVAIAASHNAASIRLLEKLGFRFERNVRLPPNEAELMLFAAATPLANARSIPADGR